MIHVGDRIIDPAARAEGDSEALIAGGPMSISSAASRSSRASPAGISGSKKVVAISVGTMALTITTVTRMVYVVWSMKWFVRPNSAAIVPNVSPVDMRSVV